MLIFFVIGLGLVIVSAQYLLLAVQHFSARVHLSPLLVGTIVMAMGATLPELALTVTSVYNSDPGLAVGNSLGSVIVILGLIFGLAVFISKIRIGTHKTQVEAMLILLAVGVYALLALFNPTWLHQPSVLLIICAISFTIILWLSWLGRNHEDISVIHQLLLRLRKHRRWSWKKILSVAVVSILGLSLGSYLVVTAVEGFSIMFAVSTTLLGLTLTSLTTSMPEIAVTIASTRAKEEKTLVGTLVGSTLFNLTLLPALAIWQTNSLKLPVQEVIWLCLSVGVFGITILLHKGRIVSRWFGLLLLLVWVSFVVSSYIFR